MFRHSPSWIPPQLPRSSLPALPPAPACLCGCVCMCCAFLSFPLLCVVAQQTVTATSFKQGVCSRLGAPRHRHFEATCLVSPSRKMSLAGGK
eukprot:1101330-Pyramimonas_sp.AAC.1